MKRNNAREYFINKGLSYSDLREEHIERLAALLSIELATYIANGDVHAQNMNMRVSKVRKKDVKVLKSGLKYAKIQVDGSYFDRREAITFSQTGFIGFGGELDDKNVAPILKAFCLWCDELKYIEKKQGA